MNIIEKIVAGHATRKTRSVAPGDVVETSVDKAIILDMIGLHQEFVDNPPKRPFDPAKVMIIFDHFVPPPSVEVAEGIKKIRTLARRWNIQQFFDYGRGGISHALAGEKGVLLPGRIVANTDSHSCAAGAFNCLSRGLGTPELMSVLCTGKTWFIVGDTIRVNLNAKIGRSVEAKDVFLKMADEIGGVPSRNIEFHGSGIASIPIEDRQEISTMCAEMSVEFAVFPSDARLRRYLEGRAEAQYKEVEPDPHTKYRDGYDLDLSRVTPMVALPDAILDNVKPVEEVEGVPIDQAVVGSCANGRLADIRTTAQILSRKSVHPRVRLIVTPATQETYLKADRLGYVSQIVKAGGVVTNSTCGSCFGGHMGVLASGEVCITSTTRNFKGRMGSREARIYMASTSTVVASAVCGRITDPRSLMGRNAN